MAARKTSAGELLFEAAIFFCLALLVFVRAHQADLHHTVIHDWLKPNFMTPVQGYILSALLACLSGYCAIGGIKRRRLQKSSEIPPQ
jgi:hypothetical protein